MQGVKLGKLGAARGLTSRMVTAANGGRSELAAGVCLALVPSVSRRIFRDWRFGGDRRVVRRYPNYGFEIWRR